MCFFQLVTESLQKGEQMQDSIHWTTLTTTAKVEGSIPLFQKY